MSDDSQQSQTKIEYREDGKTPIGLWVLWLAFAVFAVVYAYRNAWPDFVKWWSESRPR